jgi:N-acyl-D-amino-acid deacylase
MADGSLNTFDWIIQNGTVLDGRRSPGIQADIGIRGERVTQVGNLSESLAAQRVDATGQVVCPGFIDVHAHSDAWLLQQCNFLPKTSQGYTTEFLMVDGISYAPVNEETAPEWILYLRGLNGLRLRQYSGWRTIAEFVSRLDRQNVQNTATFIPYGNVRSLICGFDRYPPDDFQLKEIKSLVAQGMDQGALGLSTGFDYLGQLFSSTAELTAVCKEIANKGGIYVSHIRYKLGILDGLKEAVSIGINAGVPVHISHLKGSTPAEAEAILAYINKTAVHEVDFSFDVYPYSASSTLLSSLLPHEVWTSGSLGAAKQLSRQAVRDQFASSLAKLPLDRILIAWTATQANQDLAGKSLAEYITSTGRSSAQALIDLLIEENFAVLLVFLQGEDALVAPFLAHPHGMIGSDGIFQADGAIHPRVYGTAARVLGPCVRDQRLFSLADAVYKLSGYPAKRFDLPNRGAIQEGYFADLVCFEAGKVCDKATFANPRQAAVGINHVWVNGQRIIADSKPVIGTGSLLPGQFLHKGNREEYFSYGDAYV